MRDQRITHARAGARGSCGRYSEHGLDRRCSGLQAPTAALGTSSRTRDAGECEAWAKVRFHRRSEAVACQRERLQQALDLPAVRFNGPDQHGRRPGRGRWRSDSHQRFAARAGYGARWQRPLVLSRSEAGGDARRCRSSAQCCVLGCNAGRRNELFELWESREAADHVAIFAGN